MMERQSKLKHMYDLWRSSMSLLKPQPPVGSICIRTREEAHACVREIPISPCRRVNGIWKSMGPTNDCYPEQRWPNSQAMFLEQLLDNYHIEDYKGCKELRVTLRRYREEGISGFIFLKRFKLQGILCDDIGLGKTLQASTIVAFGIAENQTASGNEDLLPSLNCLPINTSWALGL
ncbi:hypothetical protein VNO77_04031 [Canavalia gladiata]|uniref:SNF2 N-terminal domain-containing protein n=1 Tax=Canavalia gladiata TaxID=3824 RepID=A0AAN9MWN7_CANGL